LIATFEVDVDIEFVAYASDCIVCGWISLAHDRLTDLLSADGPYPVRDVSVASLDGATALGLSTLAVLREELCIVTATGPRGSAGRRVRTRSVPVRLTAGPYEAFGYLHAAPTKDPLSAAMGRPIIPLTSAWVRFERGQESIERQHDTILVNRAQISWLDRATHEDARLAPDLRVPHAADTRAKDLTAELFD
jgi:hypothetical protein